MDYEKKYKEALERAREWYNNPNSSSIGKSYLYAVFPELRESKDEKIKSRILFSLQKDIMATKNSGCNTKELEECVAWLKKQGEQENNEWKEGNIIRHGGILALVIKGRRVMKSNGEIFTVQYPDEWVKAAPNEIEYFLNEFEKQGEQKPYGQRAECLDCQFNYAGECKGYCATKRGEQKVTYTTTMETGDGGINALVTRDFEIPFGAKDSELQEVTYFIPEGYYAKIEGDEVVIKKGEQKPTDKVEPKFHEGDWVINNQTSNIFLVKEVKDDEYCLWPLDGIIQGYLRIIDVDNEYHLWTVQDAKDGDVLCYKDEVFLYKHDIKNCTLKETTFGGMVYYCCYDGKRFITDSMYSLTEKDKDNFYPATKEQRDQLERAMTNAGYRWNKEELKLEKI